MRLGICYTLVSAENKLLLASAKSKGVKLERIVDSNAALELSAGRKKEYDTILQRSVSYSRTIYLNYYFEQQGTQVINSYKAARIFGDKALCSSELATAGIPTPKTFLAFSPETAVQAADKIGFPLVIKPAIGSWARMVHRINDADSLQAALESRAQMGNPWQKVYYLQEHINKPGRDIRAFVIGDETVAAIYRHSTEKSGWITNTAKGATTSNCKVTPDLSELCLKAASIAGSGVYAVDLMESEKGLVVHEVNHTTEFRNSIEPTGVDIPGKIIEYLIERTKR